tara:strand:- start:722 stop:1378 length:657 start_codon:yes stop_codon:yes gene_type:complete
MKNLLSSTAFLVVNKELAKKIGLNETVLLADLISKEQYFIENNQLNDGWFFNTAKNIQDDTSLTAHQQRKCIKNLRSLGIIETHLKGIPAKQHFKIIENKLLSYFNTSFKENVKQDVKKTRTINKNKEITINNNISIRKQEFSEEVFRSNLSTDICNEFCEYWTETNKSGTKMKFEMQKTFSIPLRLKRWQKNQTKWDKGTSKIDNQINEYLKGKELL